MPRISAGQPIIRQHDEVFEKRVAESDAILTPVFDALEQGEEPYLWQETLSSRIGRSGENWYVARDLGCTESWVTQRDINKLNWETVTLHNKKTGDMDVVVWAESSAYGPYVVAGREKNRPVEWESLFARAECLHVAALVAFNRGQRVAARRCLLAKSAVDVHLWHLVRRIDLDPATTGA